MPSINQNSTPQSLPNFRNLGITFRILIIVTAMGLMGALLKAPTLSEVGPAFTEIAAVLLPITLVSILALYAVSGLLVRLPYRTGVVAVVVIELALTSAVYGIAVRIGIEAMGPVQRYWVFCLFITVVLLGYFNLRNRALSPALSEARLQALQARIRPHFLFNSINAVLSLIRSDPKRAEQALEDMADLFRVLMADNRELAPLAQEVQLCREYLGLEELRLGDRLKVDWHVDNMPGDALIPPLLLQPLLENAVYHGIEPAASPGTISIHIYKKGEEVHAVLRNPYQHEGNHHGGNKMALANIRERLALHFDEEGRLETKIAGDTYQVHITMPYTTARGSRA